MQAGFSSSRRPAARWRAWLAVLFIAVHLALPVAPSTPPGAASQPFSIAAVGLDQECSDSQCG